MTVVSTPRQHCPALPRHSRERPSDESEVRITPWSSAARLSSAAISDLRYEFYPGASHPNYVRVSCNDTLYGRRELSSAMNPELPANEMPADQSQQDILLEAHSDGVSLLSLTSDPPAWVLDYDGRRDEVRCSQPRLRML